MEIRVYQIYGKPEERKEMFRGLDELNGKPVDSAIYDEVFAGFVKAHDLEKVYEILNGKKPKNSSTPARLFPPRGRESAPIPTCS